MTGKSSLGAACLGVQGLESDTDPLPVNSVVCGEGNKIITCGEDTHRCRVRHLWVIAQVPGLANCDIVNN